MKKWAKKLFAKVLPIIFTLPLLFNSFNVIPVSSAATDKTSPTPADEVKTLNGELDKASDDFKNASFLTKGLRLDELKKVSQKRKDALKKLIKEDPSKVGSVVVDDVSKYPVEVQDQIEKKGEHKGYFVRQVSDFKDNEEEKDLLFSQKDIKSSSVVLVPESDKGKIDASLVGSEVTVSGYQVDNLLWYPVSQNTTLLSSAVTSQITGSREVAVLYISFKNNRTRSLAESDIRSYAFSSYNNFLKKSSNNLFTITGNVYMLDLDIDQTCNFSVDSNDPSGIYTYDSPLVKEILYQYKWPWNPDPASVDKMVIFDPSVTNCSAPGMAFIGLRWAYSVGLGAFSHEYGHLLNIAHSQGYECSTAFVFKGCTVIKYGNRNDIMGTQNEDNGDYGAYAKESLGWLQGTQIANVSTNGTFTLEQYEEWPSSPGPSFPTKVLKVSTFSGGPAYYVYYRRANTTNPPEGPVIELASGTVAPYRLTYLLDTTPASKSSTIDDINDGYLRDGQNVTDPYNGITFKGISHTFNSATLAIEFGPKASGSATANVSWGRGTGYLVAMGQKKDMTWPKMHYLVDVKCTGPYCTGDWNQWSGDCMGISPDNLCPPIDTTDTSLTLNVGSSSLGYTYTYRVSIITLDDNDPTHTQIHAYSWKGETDASTNCNGPNTCTTTISWPKVTYKGIIFEKGTDIDPCLRMQIPGLKVGCVRSFESIQDDTSFMFRGLPTGVNFSGFLYTTDFSNTNHTIRIYNDLGQSENYFRSCSTNNDTRCTIPMFSFVGYEPILYSVRVGNETGYNISGTKSALAFADGSYSNGWGWNYRALIYTAGYSDCMAAAAAGGQCLAQDLYDANGPAYSLRFVGLTPNTNYNFLVCAFTCDQSNGNTYLFYPPIIVPSSGDAGGPSFFETDPFVASVDTDSDGCPDVKELGSDWKKGGQRDPENRWDFWDVPVPAITSTNWNLPVGDPGRPKMDHNIGAADAQAIFTYYKAGAKAGMQVKNGISYDSHYGYKMGLTNDPNFTDGMFYDRTPNPVDPVNQFWKVGPPDGVVGANDAQLEFAIFKNGGSNCN